MTIEPQIKSIIEKLNPNWFNELKEEFVNHPFYNTKSESIDDTIQEFASGYDPETGEIDEDVYDVIIHATLSEYAWKGEDYHINIPDEMEDYFVLKAKSLIPDLIAIIDPLLCEINDIKEKHNLIILVIQFMIEQSTELKKQLDESGYHDVIDYCIYKFRLGLLKKYISISKAHDTIAVYEDKLLFDLSKKELSFLLALLIECKFIHGSEYNNNHLDFFRKYFYFKNQKAGNNFQKASDINKKISDVSSSSNADYLSIKERMKNRLIKAISEL